MIEISKVALDPTTFLFCMSLFGFMMAAISYSTATTLGANIAGLREWSKAMLLTGVAFLLFYMRGKTNEIVTVYVANMLILAMSVLTTMAHARFFNIPPPRKLLAAVVSGGSFGVTYCYHFMSDRSGLVLSISLTIALILLLLIHMIFRNAQWKTQPSTWISLTSMILMASALLFRSWKVVFSDSASVALFAKSGTQFGFLVSGALCIMGTSMGFILMVHEKHRRDILESSKRDGLTGLYHRSAFFEQAAKIQESDSTPYGVVMVDIVFFKSINDTHGHASGDVAIMHIARLIANSARNTDLAGRYGGEEFCILLRNCGEEETEKFAQRLVDEASKQRIRLPEGREIGLTISAGYSWRPDARRKEDPRPSVKTLLEYADQALLVAKKTGRNRAMSS